MTQFFRLLFIRLVMNLAVSVFYITVLWYVNNHYSSSFFLGIFMALIALPDLLLIFWGPLIDRINPKKVLLMSIIVQMFSIMLLLILKNDLNFLLLSVLVFVSIMASSVSYVIEDVLIPQIVDYNKIVLANSVFSLSYKALDAIFNALTSFLQTIFGMFVLFKLNLGIFAVALLLVCLFKFNWQADKELSKFSVKTYKLELKEGMHFIKENSLLASTTLVLFIINFFYAIQLVALPIFSKLYFDGAVFYGLVLTINGLGGMIGNALTPFLVKYLKPYQLIGVFLSLNAISWMIAILARNYSLTLALLFLASLTSGVYNVIFGSLYQQIPPSHLLGRVNATVDSLITLGMPLGSLIGGIVLDKNPYLVMQLLAVPTLISGYYFFHNKHLRHFELK